MSYFFRERFFFSNKLLLGLGLGIFLGLLVGRIDTQAALYLRPFAELFLRLIKMILAPLVLSSLVVAIAGSETRVKVARLATSAVLCFQAMTVVALCLGFSAAHWLKPGLGLSIPNTKPLLNFPPMASTWDQILVRIAPESLLQAMLQGNMLQIVFFGVLFGVALRLIGERALPTIQLARAVSVTMFKMMELVMVYAPVGIGASVAYVLAHQGWALAFKLLQLLAALIVAYLLIFLVLMVPCAIGLKIPMRKFLRTIREPLLTALSTSSSTAAMPRAMELLQKFGVPKPVVSLIYPLSYSSNMLGSSALVALCTIFVAQAAGIQLAWQTQISMAALLLITTKSIVGVYGASLAGLAATLLSYHLPIEGLMLVLGVHPLMDMLCAAMNTLNHCFCTVAVAAWHSQTHAPAVVEEP